MYHWWLKGKSYIGSHQQYLELSVMVHLRVKYRKERTTNFQYRMDEISMDVCRIDKTTDSQDAINLFLEKCF